MPVISVSVVGLEKLLAVVEPHVALYPPIRHFFQESAKTVWSEVFHRTPRKTGHLQAHLYAQVDQSPLPLWAKVGFQPLDYAEWVEYGTGVYSTNPLSNKQPIDIWPTAKQALYWPGATHPVRHVVQQGQHGRHMLRDGWQASLPKINAFLAAAGQQIVNKLAGH